MQLEDFRGLPQLFYGNIIPYGEFEVALLHDTPGHLREGQTPRLRLLPNKGPTELNGLHTRILQN